MLNKKLLYRSSFFVTLFLIVNSFANIAPNISKYTAQKYNSNKLWSVRIAESFLANNPHIIMYNNAESQVWNYEQGLMLEAMKRMFLYTGEDKYFNYIEQNIDQLVQKDGDIKTYRVDEFNLDQVAPGRAVLYLYQVTANKKYKIACETIRKQLANQPRTNSNGFWHKKIYPNQMWLDGLYMAEPFYAEYAKQFHEISDYDDIAHQFELVYEKTLDPKTGLLYHAWDESTQQKWANPETGQSPNFWGRSIGWYVMGLVDVLDSFPKDNPHREKLISIFQKVCDALLKFKDRKTSAWFQVLDQGRRKGNYVEASASCMYTYVFARGYNMGYLNSNYLLQAQLAFAGILKQFVTIDENGCVNLNHVCSVAGLGGKNNRDGSFEYYISEPQRTNDFKGYGPLWLAAIELERGQKKVGYGVKVALDNYYNNETRKNEKGKTEKFHYILEDKTNSGYSEFGDIFKKYGAKISELRSAPTEKKLKPYSIYIIVDPDTPQETPKPNYISDNNIDVITNWISGGGILVLLANDKGNCEFDHLNNLAGKFGFHFNEVSLNKVEGRNFNQGAFTNLPFHPIFNSVNKIYMKEISTITVDEPKHAILKKDSDVVIAFKRFGNGGVLTIGDPWLYNEYILHRLLPEDFENFTAAENLVKWLLDLSNEIKYSK